jgi:hypothetical protein
MLQTDVARCKYKTTSLGKEDEARERCIQIDQDLPWARLWCVQRDNLGRDGPGLVVDGSFVRFWDVDFRHCDRAVQTLYK